MISSAKYVLCNLVDLDILVYHSEIPFIWYLHVAENMKFRGMQWCVFVYRNDSEVMGSDI